MIKYLVLFLMLCVLTLGSCNESDPPVIENEEEVITDLVYTLRPVGSGIPVTMTFRDPDGDGGQAPSLLVSGSLRPNQEYDGSLILLNNSNPANPGDITTEVRNEGADHQFFYIPGGGLQVAPAYDDSDANGDPLGLETTLMTGDSSAGTLRILLRHEPNKQASGIGITDPAAAGGETDIEVTFAVEVSN